MSKKKKKKEKIVYVDDNSTIADMSGSGRTGAPREPRRSRSTFREKLHTYFASVKMMLIPMCIVLFVMAAIFLLLLWGTGRL